MSRTGPQEWEGRAGYMKGVDRFGEIEARTEVILGKW